MIGVKFDRTLSLWPWPIRGRPYVALHIAHWGHCHYAGEQGSHRMYHVGVMWGRFYRAGGGAKWWRVTMPWRERE